MATNDKVGVDLGLVSHVFAHTNAYVYLNSFAKKQFQKYGAIGKIQVETETVMVVGNVFVVANYGKG